MTPAELPTIGQTIRHALALDGEIYRAVQHAPSGIWVALVVVGLAGLSESVGQSLVLFINRIQPRRFVLAVMLSVLSYIVGYLLWAASVWLVGTYAFGREVGWVPVAAAVGLAYAPQIFAFFELTPFFGNPFGILLSLWSMLAIVVAVRVGLDMETWQAVVAAGLGWLVIQLWRRTLGRPVYAFGQWSSQRAAGVPLRYSLEDIAKLRRPSAFREREAWRRRPESSDAVENQHDEVPRG